MRADVSHCGAFLYAIIPARVDGLSLALGRTFKRGDTVPCNMEVRSTPPSSVSSVVHVEFGKGVCGTLREREIRRTDAVYR